MQTGSRVPGEAGTGRLSGWPAKIGHFLDTILQFYHNFHIPGTAGSTNPVLEKFEKVVKHVRIPHRYRVAVMLTGGTVALVGFFLPWSGYSYSPPKSFATAHPLYPSPYVVYQQFYNGISIMWFNSGLNGNARDLHLVLNVFLVLAAILLMLALAIASASSELAGNWPRYVVLRVFTFLAHAAAGVGILLTTFGDDIGGLNQTMARLQFAQDYGGSAAARQAAQYWDFHTGIGIYLMVLGGGAAFLASFFPERRFTAEEFDARGKWYRACAGRVGKAGDFAVGGMYVLIVLTVAIVIGVIIDRWLIHKGVIRF